MELTMGVFVIKCTNTWLGILYCALTPQPQQPTFGEEDAPHSGLGVGDSTAKLTTD